MRGSRRAAARPRHWPRLHSELAIRCAHNQVLKAVQRALLILCIASALVTLAAARHGGIIFTATQPLAGSTASIIGAHTAHTSFHRKPSRRVLIEDGWTAPISEFPYAVMVVLPGSGKYLCTGTLVHPRVVITAAHCVTPELDGVPDPDVVLGRDQLAAANNRALRVATRSYTHPDFSAGSFDYDIAALVLSESTKLKPARMVQTGSPLGVAAANKKSVAPYHLWTAGAGMAQVSDGADIFSSKQLIVLGWGATNEGGLPSGLQQSRVTPVSLDVCRQMFQPFKSKVTDNMICVSGETCAGDSGGPLLSTASGSGLVVVGQVSFGYPRQRIGQGCPVPNPVTAFTDLSSPSIRQWLDNEVISKLVKVGSPPRG